MHKIVLTGGHAGTTALAVIEELVKRGRNIDIYWLGPSKALEGKKTATLEAKVFPRLGVNFHPIVAGRLQKRWTIHTLPSALKIPFGFLHAAYLLIKIRPKVVLSFGGFAAFPVVVVAWLLRIPVILHEQTADLGLANRLSVPFARKVAMARKETKVLVPAKKAILTGNPVMSSILAVGPKVTLGKPPTIFITGGSRGAQSINKIVDASLEKLLSEFVVIHHTGEIDFSHFVQRAKDLKDKFPNRYEVYQFIEPDDIADIYRQADIIISRAGANTVSEIMVTARPALLIPIPWSKYNEQNKNALAAKKAGIALLMEQDELTSEELIENVQKLKQNWSEMTKKMDRTLAKLDAQASSRLVDIVESVW